MFQFPFNEQYFGDLNHRFYHENFIKENPPFRLFPTKADFSIFPIKNQRQRYEDCLPLKNSKPIENKGKEIGYLH